MMKKLGIVIINYNDYKTTARLLENIKSYSCLNKIVVVDNASTDNSYKMLKEFESNRITIIKNRENKGYATGLNTGAKYLIKELGKCNIIFSNSDVIIKGDTDLKKLSSDIKGDVVVVGPTIEELGTLNRGFKASTITDEILFNLPLISRYFRKKKTKYTDDHFKGDTSTVDYVSGCFFCVDSEVLEEVNYFDENTFLYYEELIFYSKLKKINKKELIDNKVRIVHDHSVSIDKSFKRVNKYKILKDSQRYYVKEYLGANKIQLALLYLTNKLSLLILYIRCLLRR